MKKNKPQSSLDFKFMAFFFKIRDIFNPPIEKIRNTSVQERDHVLDYGCGPGSYAIAAARQVGPNGKIYTADINPNALKMVKKKALKQGLNNIETIQTDCNTGLGDKSMDVILCFDMLHDVPNKDELIREFHRVLKQGKTLSLDDHHSEEKEIVEFMTSAGLFKLSEKKGEQYNFIKV